MDLIDRQDAIDACLNGCCACVNDCVDEIEKLPSAQKTGKWIKREPWKRVPTQCSECGHEFNEYVEGYEWEETGDLPNFCPNCGARMVGEEE